MVRGTRGGGEGGGAGVLASSNYSGLESSVRRGMGSGLPY